jgi:hypothetical protein
MVFKSYFKHPLLPDQIKESVMIPVLDVKHLETFVYDYERLRAIHFQNSEYDINQMSIIIRKLLLDASGVLNFWPHFSSDKLRLFSLNHSEQFEARLLSNIKLHIPMLNVLPIVVITNYFSIRSDHFFGPNASRQVKYPEILHSEVNIERYLNESYIVVDGEFINRRDIIEFVCYGVGAVHYGVKGSKIERLKKVKKLSFSYAQGIEKPDALFSFMVSFSSPEEDLKYRDDPNFAKYLVTLGERHSFESLMILQIAHDVSSSTHVINLYQKAKEYLVANVPKFRGYDPASVFTKI